MDIMSYNDLITEVTANVIDLPPTVAAAVPALINNAIQAIQRKYNFRAMEAMQSYVTLPNDFRLFGTINNFKEYRDRGPYVLNYLSRSRRLLTNLDSDVDMATLTNQTLSHSPEFIISTLSPASGDHAFSIRPYPDALSDWPDGNYRINIPYYGYTAPLAEPNDDNWFSINANEYIVFKATAEAFMKDWDYQSMSVWLTRADEKYKEVRSADVRERFAQAGDTLIPHYQGTEAPKGYW